MDAPLESLILVLLDWGLLLERVVHLWSLVIVQAAQPHLRFLVGLGCCLVRSCSCPLLFLSLLFLLFSSPLPLFLLFLRRKNTKQRQCGGLVRFVWLVALFFQSINSRFFFLLLFCCCCCLVCFFLLWGSCDFLQCVRKMVGHLTILSTAAHLHARASQKYMSALFCANPVVSNHIAKTPCPFPDEKNQKNVVCFWLFLFSFLSAFFLTDNNNKDFFFSLFLFLFLSLFVFVFSVPHSTITPAFSPITDQPTTRLCVPPHLQLHLGSDSTMSFPVVSIVCMCVCGSMCLEKKREKKMGRQ